MTSHVSWENKFEVMYTREQLNYEAENIIELLISHIIYVYWSWKFNLNIRLQRLNAVKKA
jgi:hypothetical protein